MKKALYSGYGIDTNDENHDNFIYHIAPGVDIRDTICKHEETLNACTKKHAKLLNDVDQFSNNSKCFKWKYTQ